MLGKGRRGAGEMVTLLVILITLPVQVVSILTFAREARASRGGWRKLLWLAAMSTVFNFALSLGFAIAQIAIT